jgi:hypothetical protein
LVSDSDKGAEPMYVSLHGFVDVPSPPKWNGKFRLGSQPIQVVPELALLVFLIVYIHSLKLKIAIPFNY